MNYFLLAYPIISFAIFFSIFIFPFGIVFAVALSPLLLLRYFENILRTKYTDIVVILIFIVGAVFDPVGSIAYLLFVFLPMVLLFYTRAKMPDYVYLPSFAAPLLAAITAAVVVAFFPEGREQIYEHMLSSVTTFTAPLENTPERFGDYGALSFMVANKERAAQYFTYLLPSALYILISLMTFLADRVSPIFKDGKITLRDYRLPDQLVWVLIAGGFLVLINNESVKFVSYNILLIFGLLYFYQGVQMVTIFFDRMNLSRLFRLVIYALIFTEPPVMLLLSIIGLFSIWYRPKWSLRGAANDENGGGREA